MKNLRKLTAVLLALSGLFRIISPVHADLNTIGTTKVTDIVAFIDTNYIPCYNYNGYTFICAEDLQYYGFDVNWNADTRTLSVDYNPAKPRVENRNLPEDLGLNTGLDLHQVYASENRVIMNGYPIEAYSLNGQMIINFENLSCLGEVVWHNGIRAIYVTTERFRGANPDWKNTLPPLIATGILYKFGLTASRNRMNLMHRVTAILEDFQQTRPYDYSRSMAPAVDAEEYAQTEILRNNLQARCDTLEQMADFYLKDEIYQTSKELVVECDGYLTYANRLGFTTCEFMAIYGSFPYNGSAYALTFMNDLSKKAFDGIRPY